MRFPAVSLVLLLAAAAASPALFGQVSFNNVATFAGTPIPVVAGQFSPGGLVDGTGATARFSYPREVAVDSAGNVFVTDDYNHAIRKITPGGVVTTFAGDGTAGSADGTGTAARFFRPFGIAIDTADNLYVADSGNNTIRRITPAAVVTTLAGTPGVRGGADGTGSAAQLDAPVDLVVDGAGVVFFTDNDTVRQLTPAGVVTTLAGAYGFSGSVDATGSDARFFRPYGIALDVAGNLYVTDGSLRKITPSGVVTTLAGSASVTGSADGFGTAARFFSPRMLVLDASGFIYVVDGGNATIRLVTPGGTVTTIAGLALSYGSTDGAPLDARFYNPTGLAFDSVGSLYIVDTANQTIRKMTPVGAPVITAQPLDRIAFVGSPATTFSVTAGSILPAPIAYRWQRLPAGSATWGDLANGGSYASVTTSTLSVLNATLAMSGDQFRCIASNGLPPDATSNAALLTVVDPNQTITFPAPADRTYGDVPFALGATASSGLPVSYTIVSGPATIAGDTVTLTGVGTITVRASQPGNGTTFIAAPDVERSFVVAKKTLTARATDLTRARGYANPVFAINYTGFVGGETASVIDTLPVAGTTADVASAVGTFPITLTGGSDDNYTLTLINGALTIVPGYTFRTLAGTAGESGFRDGAGKAVRFDGPRGFALDGAGNLLVADIRNQVIRRITPEGAVTLFAGTPGVSGSDDGPALSARFNQPVELAVDGAGNVFVADQNNNAIRRISAAGVVTTFARRAENAPYAWSLQGIAVDVSGNVYVSDANEETVRKYTAAGVESILAGRPREEGSEDGPAGTARFNSPAGLAVDAAGTVYVADRFNFTIRKISPAGVVTTLAGLAGQGGITDGVGSAARFDAPHSIALDASGTLFVTDSSTARVGGAPGAAVRRITPDGTVTTLAGSRESFGSADGTGNGARFLSPIGIAVSAAGVVYVADSGVETIRVGVDLVSPPTITTQPQSVILATNPPEILFTVRASGGPPPGFQWQGLVAGGGAWVDLADDATYANVTGPTLTVRNPDATMSGRRFRAIVNNLVDPQAVSDAAVLNVVVGGGAFTGTFTPTGGAQPLRVAASSTNGDWALFRRPDNTATFIAYLAASQSAIVLELAIATDGSFSANGTTSVVQNGAIANGTAFTLTGQITGGVFSAQLTGLNLSLSGALDATPGVAAQFAGLYSAAQLNASSGTTYVIVGASGDAVIVTLTPTGISGGLGTMNASGQLAAVLASGAAFSANASAATLGFTAQITPAGSTSASSFAGLSSFVTPVNRLVNISTRGFVGSGAQSLIAGFVIAGPADKQVLVRAVGPTLAVFNLANPVADPALEIVRQQNGVITFSATNDNWGSAATSPAIVTASTQVSAFALPDGSADSALLSTLVPGAYTALARAQTGGNGVGLVEVYETPGTASADLRLINISTRAQVNTGEQILIAGFVVTGNAPKKLLIRGIGPGLAPFFPVAEQSSLLADPRLELFDGAQATIATNDDWGAGSDAALITAASTAVSAFPLPAGSKDAVLLLNLQPGQYTVHLTGVAAASGLALAEVYELP